MTARNVEDATRASARVALVTCAELPDLDPDDRLLTEPLTALGARPEAVVWDDPAVDWAAYDLVVVRSTWDYVERRDEFLDWAARVPALANPADVLAWSTDKRYLRELEAAGARIVPTVWLSPDDDWRTPGRLASWISQAGEFVVKPVVSAGSRDTGRYDAARPEHRGLAEEHLTRLLAAGRHVMVQPYLAAVDTYGETALLFLGGPGGLRFSHAIRKGPMLTGPELLADDELFRAEEITAREASEAELAAARPALAAVPGGADRLLYARVDLIPGPDGSPLVVELEVAEPSLFLGTAEAAPERFAEAIAWAASSAAAPFAA